MTKASEMPAVAMASVSSVALPSRARKSAAVDGGPYRRHGTVAGHSDFDVGGDLDVEHRCRRF